MTVIFENIVIIAPIFGFCLLYELFDIVFLRKKTQNRVLSVLHNLKLPLVVVSLVILSLLLVFQEATMAEMLVLILAFLIIAFL